MSALPKLHFTPEEYLALEGPAEYKSQYIAGEIFAMAGAEEAWHDKVVSNLHFALRKRLGDRPCDVFTSDMRVRAAEGDMYTYPDLSALCGEANFGGGGKPYSLLNPQAIFEVLSASTRGFDRGEKFARYRRIPSLVDYVLADSEQMHIEHHIRQPTGAWTHQEYAHPSNVFRLVGIDCELALAEIYERVRFPPGG